MGSLWVYAWETLDSECILLQDQEEVGDAIFVYPFPMGSWLDILGQQTAVWSS